MIPDCIQTEAQENMGLTDTGRFISLILRHKPETIGICLDEHGWAKHVPVRYLKQVMHED